MPILRSRLGALGVLCAAALLACAQELECKDGVCAVPESWASAKSPPAPDFAVTDVEDDKAADNTAAQKATTPEAQGASADGKEEAAKEPEEVAAATATAGDAGLECKDGVCKVPDSWTSAAAAAASTPTTEGKAEEGEAAANTGVPASSKIGLSKVAAAAATGPSDEAVADAATEAPAKAAAMEPPTATPSAAAAEEDVFDLDTEISLMRVMAQMGSTTTMMDILVNATFKLADRDRDDRISRQEAAAFAREHILPEEAKLGAALGLRGGHMPALTEAHASGAIDRVFGACDADSDGHVDRPEAMACRQPVYGMLVEANQRLAEYELKKQQEAAAAAAATPGERPKQQAPPQQAQQAQQAPPQQPQRDATAAAGQRPRQPEATTMTTPPGGALGPLAPLYAELGRLLVAFQKQLLRNFRNPTINTALGAFAAASMVLRELLAANLFGLRDAMREMVGSNVQEFNTRLLALGVVAGLAAQFGHF